MVVLVLLVLLITLGLLYYINEDLIKALIHDVFGGSMGAKYKRIPEFAMFRMCTVLHGCSAWGHGASSA